jgi:HEAT repeat protein/VWA domain-containing protein
MQLSRFPAAVVLALGLIAAPTLQETARADATPTVVEATKALLESIGQPGEVLARAKRIQRLAVIDSAEAMRGILAGMDVFVGKWDKRQLAAERTYKTFKDSGYDKFVSNSDPRFWDTKKRLTEQIEKHDEELRADASVASVFVASISKLKSVEAVDQLARAIQQEGRPRTRTMLYEGLLRCPTADGPDILRHAQKDSAPTVRLRAIEACTARTEPDLVPLLVKSLKEKGWPHRQAAARALGSIPDVRAIAPLINAMGIEEGRLVEVYADALAAITGEKLGPFPESWKQWFDDHKEDLVAKGAGKSKAKKPRKIKRKQVSYYGIKSLSKRIVFIIDVSGSMKEIIGEEDKAPLTGDDEESFRGPKIEIAKRTLKQAVRTLDEHTHFNIVIYNHSVRVFHETMLKADQAGKNKAYLMINDLEPLGSTYTYGALKETFLMAGRGASDKTYDPGVDTIFLLSDGAPTNNDIDKPQPMEGKVILDAVKEWNSLKRVQIHTIAIDPQLGTGKGKFIKFMRSLAKRHGGTYAEIPSGNKKRR